MAVNTHAYYLPYYFQAIKGTSAAQSGIRILPYLVAMTGITLVTGPIISRVGYYVPFLWVGASFTTIGSGLLFTLKVNSGAGPWIGYQIIAGLGVGIAVQIPFIAVQVVLPKNDMPSGSGLLGFFNALGGALSISIAQNIFASTLAKRLEQLPNIDAAAVIAAGAANITSAISENQIGVVREAYDYALMRAFILPIAVGGGAFAASLVMEWRSVKENQSSGTQSGPRDERV
jgi:MFS family permease